MIETVLALSTSRIIEALWIRCVLCTRLSLYFEHELCETPPFPSSNDALAPE